MRENPLAMVHALGGARDDRALWREAVMRNCNVLKHVPDAIRSDRAFMEPLVREKAMGDGARARRCAW